MRREHETGVVALQPGPDRFDFTLVRLLLGDEVVEAEDHERVGVREDPLVDREAVPCLVDPLIDRDRVSVRFFRGFLEAEHAAMEQLEGARDALEKIHFVPLRRFEPGPPDAPHLGHGRETVVELRDVAVGLPRITPGPIDAETPLAPGVLPRHVRLVVGASSAVGPRHQESFPFPFPASQASALSPGRKKYAPPRTVVNAGRPVMVLRIGRLGILYSSVPSWLPMIGSRSLPSSWKFLSLAQTFCANSNWRIRLPQITKAAIPRSWPSSGASSGRCGP